MLITISRFVLAAALALLAASIAYFAYVVKKIDRNLPTIAERTQTASESVSLAAQQVKEIIPHIPFILAETGKIRASVAEVLKESAEVRNESAALRLRVEKMQAVLPDILTESASIRAMLPGVIDEVADMRTTLKQTTAEIKAVRESLPTTLVAVETLIDKADATGKRASEGAISGLLTGIVKAPYSVVRDLGETFKWEKNASISQKDLTMIISSANRVLSLDKVGERSPFTNDDQSLAGFVELVKMNALGRDECKRIRISINGIDDVSKTACQNKEGSWIVEKD